MPRFPAFLARAAEARGVPCRVEKIEDLSARFRRVHLAGDALRGHAWEPCQVTSFRVTPTEFRHYTPDGYDSGDGGMSILFYRHRTEPPLPPGEAWLEGLAAGDTVIAMKPGAARGFRAPSAAGTHLVFGDATTVGLWHSLICRLGDGMSIRGAVEVPEAEGDLVRELLPGLDVLPEGTAPGAALSSWLERRGADGLGGSAHVYLAGHGPTIQELRRSLRERHGLGRAAISTQPYWVPGKAGL